MRLQRYLAMCGVASRRACEALIEAGRVSVAGEVVRRQGVTVDPAADDVRVDGRPVRAERKVYRLLHKPRGFVCTARDPEGRPTALGLVQAPPGVRLFTIGRLDFDSEGLLILTNDGDLAQALAHPRHRVSKTYIAEAEQELSAPDLARMRSGVAEGGETLRAERVAPLPRRGRFPRYEVVLREGRRRQIRRMFDACGSRVRRLLRVAIGPLRIGPLRVGEWRELTSPEIRSLRNCAGPAGRSVIPESVKTRIPEEL